MFRALTSTAVSGVVSSAVSAATSMIGDAVRPVVRDAVQRAMLLAVALILFAGTVVFGEMALYFWLRTHLSAPAAALIMAGATLILMLIVLLIATRGTSGRGSGGAARNRSSVGLTADQPQERASGASADEAEINGEQQRSAHGTSADDITHLAAEAEALGKMLGRDAKGYQLVLGAFLVGMLLGRGR